MPLCVWRIILGGSDNTRRHISLKLRRTGFEKEQNFAHGTLDVLLVDECETQVDSAPQNGRVRIL